MPTDDQTPKARRREHATLRNDGTGEGGPARLVVLAGGPVGRRFAVSETETIIGRSRSVAVQIDDPQLSRSHACIRRAPGGWEIEDLDSMNGTSVNERRITKGQLHFGDQIQLGGDVLLQFTQHDSLKEQLLQRQRLEALGRLTAGISHDFNNMLGAIIASLDYALLNQPQGTDPEYRDSMDDARTAAERASELCARLLAFVASDAHEYRRVDISKLVRDVQKLVARTVGRAIEVTATVDEDLCVTGDAASLHQVLMNLCLNARDAMAEGGTMHLSAAWVAGEPPTVVVKVRDTGVGMAQAVMNRMFEPFFTTKPSEGGFGLGLATAQETVEAHDGKLTVDSTLGQGSTFTVTLPAYERETFPTESFATVRPPPPTDQVIMVVDDEAIVRRASRRLLTSAGYEVVEARSGEEALRLYQAGPRPDLVLLDLEMPGIHGIQTLREIKAMDKHARVVIVSGHVDTARLDAPTLIAATGVVPKPCGARELIGAVAMALERPLRRSSHPTLERMARVAIDDPPTEEG